MPISERVAVFVDGENLNADHAQAILRIAERFGSPTLLRVYGDSSRLPTWRTTAGFRLIDSGTCKNATDILLVVQAMHWTASGEFGSVVIASSDGDFSHLAVHLRETGLTVIGVGDARATERFRGACTVFHQIGPESAVAKVPAPVVKLSGKESLEQKIARIIRLKAVDPAGLPLTELNNALRREGDFKITAHATSWAAFLSRHTGTFALDRTGPNPSVRLIAQDGKS